MIVRACWAGSQNAPKLAVLPTALPVTNCQDALEAGLPLLFPLKTHLPHKAASFSSFFSPLLVTVSYSLLPPKVSLFTSPSSANRLLSIPNNTYVLLSNSSSLKPPLSRLHEKQNGVCFFFRFFSRLLRRSRIFNHQHQNQHHNHYSLDLSS